ncbi:MAG: type II secretion system GspH family protein [Myxococcales bacterium]|nr:type II secretion system GspH family protein [Myxococcales bacterium]
MLNPKRNPRTQELLERRRRRQEGMTLVEIMIVVIIMALIATAVGVAVLPQLQKARIESTRTDAQTISSAVVMYLMDTPGGGCPATSDLVEGGYIDRNKRTVDAWDQEFQIECQGTDVLVISSGPDQTFGTEDDVQ